MSDLSHEANSLPTAFDTPHTPELIPGEDDAGFWAHTRARRLVFQHCNVCGTVRHPPIAVCGACQSRSYYWMDAPPKALIYSATTVYHAMDSSVIGDVPYVVIVVVFPHLPGVRFVSNLIETDRQPLIGTAVDLVWQPLTCGLNLPKFRIAQPVA